MVQTCAALQTAGKKLLREVENRDFSGVKIRLSANEKQKVEPAKMLFDELKARKKNISVEVVLIAVDASSERLARTLRKEFNKDKSLTVQIERQREKRGLFGLFGGVEYELLEDEAESDEPVSSGQRVGRCGGIALFCLVDILALIFLEPTLVWPLWLW